MTSEARDDKLKILMYHFQMKNIFVQKNISDCLNILAKCELQVLLPSIKIKYQESLYFYLALYTFVKTYIHFSFRNMDQRSQIIDQHDLSDSDALPLLNPNEVIPLVLPIAPSYKEVQTKGNIKEEKLQIGDDVENQDSNKSVIVDEPVAESEFVIKTEPEPMDPSSGDEKDSKESEDEHSDVNDRLTEDEVKEAQEAHKKLLEEKLVKQEVKEENEQTQIKLENEGQEDTGLLTPPELRTPLSSPTNIVDVDLDASSVSSLMVSPIKLMRLSQESSQSPEHAVYRIKRDRLKKREPPMIIPPYQPQSTQSTSENDASSQFPKPPYSYSVLIMLALKNSYRGALRVCDIYSFIWYSFI